MRILSFPLMVDGGLLSPPEWWQQVSYLPFGQTGSHLTPLHLLLQSILLPSVTKGLVLKGKLQMQLPLACFQPYWAHHNYKIKSHPLMGQRAGPGPASQGASSSKPAPVPSCPATPHGFWFHARTATKLRLSSRSSRILLTYWQTHL